MLISGAYGVDPVNGWVRKNWSILVEGSEIVDAGERGLMRTRYPSEEEHHGKRTLLMPALVNCHTHLPMVLLRSASSQLTMERWFSDVVYPREKILRSNPELVKLGSKVALAEMVLEGVGAVVDMYFMEEQVVQAGLEIGVKGVYTYGLADVGDESKMRSELNSAKSLFGMIRRLGKKSVKTAIAPHAIYTCSPSLLKEASRLADELSLPVHIHLAERSDELKLVEKMYNVRASSYSSYLDSVGLMRSSLLGFHGTQLTQEDISRLGSVGAGVVANPTSNLRLGNGISPVSLFAKYGVLRGFGTDGACSNDEQSVLRELKMAALLSTVQGSAGLTEWEILRAAVSPMTFLFGDRVGLERGCVANIALYEMDIGFNAESNIPRGIIYSPSGLRCTHTMIDGRFLVRDGSLTDISTDELMSDYSKAVSIIESKVGSEQL
ncbi:MAG: amidohydrolase family protein [Candidatus Marsarchaeota archaeon]|nr:amidohydrolase family protein [Candidatus Marsarchaeota archaeon]